MTTINIANDYTKTPGGRYIKEGPYSGEEFRENILKPAFLESRKSQDKLVVILDGGYGYGSSFLEEAFGGLVRDLGDNDIRNIIIVSDEEKELVDRVYKYIDDALKNKMRIN